MSADATTHSDGHSHGYPYGYQVVAPQYEDIEQQNESYIVGMWAFLVTEIMFFGGLFTAYLVYRMIDPETFNWASHHLNIWMGFGNTLILLSSSLFMALAVRASARRQRGALMTWLVLVILCAFGFLIVKYFEYSSKFEHHLFPGAGFQWHDAPTAVGHHIDGAKAQLFFSLYFIMTGLHGIHVILGILTLGIILFLVWRKSKHVEDYMTVELAGLYWHFVDLVWIFLYPLFYLINPPR